jgi:hypothetical protein
VVLSLHAGKQVLVVRCMRRKKWAAVGGPCEVVNYRESGCC